jgi:phage terminase small subunit
MAAGLTEKQKRFCEEYLIDLNATRAYKAAYPSVKREETAASAAARMLRNVKVAEHIRERMEDRQKRTEITQDKVLRELAAIAFADVTDIVSFNGGRVVIKPTDDLPRETRKIIAGIKEGQYGTEVKTYDRIRALELLGKHLGMFDQKDELDKEEQKVRIAKLRRDAQSEEEKAEIAVSILGVDVEELGEIIG